MRRTHLPLDQKGPEAQAHAPASEEQGDLAEASGKPAGMPLYLGQAPAATLDSAIEPEIDDELAGTVEEALEEQLIEGMAEEGAAPARDAHPQSLPDVSGTGIETEAIAHSLSLQGLTEASFSSSFRTRNLRTSPATGCDTCDDCVHVTGTLISTFSVTTTVTLPSVSDFPDLTACQRRRVRDAINNILAPHERQHVRAFRTYNGTVRTPIDLTICRTDLDSSIQALHDSVEGPRQAAAQALSDALDPFVFDVDIDCED
jgi:hypothetical protein